MENNINKLSDNDVTAHTAAMWKYNPVPESPEPYPEASCSSANESGFEVFGATVRGKKHKHDGTNCDDFYAFEIFDGTVIAAAAQDSGHYRIEAVERQTDGGRVQINTRTVQHRLLGSAKEEGDNLPCKEQQEQTDCR